MRHLIFAGAVLLLFTSEVSAQRFGLTAGTNFQRLTDVDLNSVETVFEEQSGWHAGAWFEVPVGPVGMRLAGRYLEAGRLFNGLEENFPIVNDNFDISLVDLSLLLRYGLKSPIIAPYVFAGPTFRIPARVDKIINNDLASLSYALEFGGGIEFNIGSLSLYPEVAYLLGLSTFIEDELVLDFVTLTAGDTQRLNSIIVRLSVGL
ncbi:MAG: hypothetical protein OXM02_11470 [Bacteroidota bacterium]|nr:hypothetical protein [Bacteroidota bacterium]MDE2835121.1 hypothetical protein [Bacteroidota bacterium]